MGLLVGVCGAILGTLVVLLPRSPDPAPPTGDLTATGKPVMNAWWDRTWSATVPTEEAVPQQLLSDQSCAPLQEWATARGAVPRGRAMVAYTLQAPAERQVIVTAARAVVGRTLPAPVGSDVECVGGTDRNVGMALGAPESLNIDGGSPRLLSRYVRPGGVAGQLIEVTTTTCTCEWWIELKVLDNGRERTVRVDDGGRPFTIAPPVDPIGTPADRALSGLGAPELPLAREPGDGERSPADQAARASWLSPSQHDSWRISVDRPPADIDALAADMDVPGVPCERMYRALLDTGGQLNDHVTYGVAVATPDEGPLAIDIALHVEDVAKPRSGRSVYECYPSRWEVQSNLNREETSVSLAGLAADATVPVVEDVQRLAWRPGESDDAWATTVLFFGVDAGEAVHHFTVRVRITDAQGRTTDTTLTDGGEPFVIAGGPAMWPTPSTEHIFEESGDFVR